MGFSPADVLMMQQRLAKPSHDATGDDGVGDGEEIESLHRPAVKWLTERGVAFIYNRPDRASTTTLGAPDLVIASNNSLFIEFKTKSGKLSDKQQEWHFLASRAGAEVHIIRSMQSFLALMKEKGVE